MKALKKAERSKGVSGKTAQTQDLETLWIMSIYMRSELLRLGSNGFWAIAFLPTLLDNELRALREGRPLSCNELSGTVNDNRDPTSEADNPRS